VKRLSILLFACTAAACSSTGPSSPSAELRSLHTQADLDLPAGGGSVDAPSLPTEPSGPSAPALGLTFSGPSGCVTATGGMMQWFLQVADAGPRGAHLVAVAHHDREPGCGATVAGALDRVVVTGPHDYPPHGAGETRFSFDQSGFTCGRVQIDISAFDKTATGGETLLLGMVVDYGSACTTAQPPVSPQILCTPATQTVAPNQAVSFSATGGAGPFSWAAPDAATTAGSGQTFATSYASAGTYSVTVSNGSTSATCRVTVATGPLPLACAPPTQTVSTGQAAVLTATGGAGGYIWSAPAGSSVTGTGSSFSTSYAAPGTHTVTVTSGMATASCQIVVTAPPVAVTCGPSTRSVVTGEVLTLTAAGGTGNYSWSAPHATTTTGTGTSFSTSYSSVGTNVITVASGSISCQVTVTVSLAPTPLQCAPATQSASVNQSVTLTGSGGSGSYMWSAPGASTSSGAGTPFTTSYPSTGTHTVTLTSGAASTTCQVTVSGPTPLSCSPAFQVVGLTNPATLTASGGTGSYTWSAPTGDPTGGSGSTFVTSFPGPGLATVTVSSGGQTANCQVSVPVSNVSCTNVTATIVTPLTLPTGTVHVTIPANQQAHINIESWNHATNTGTVQNYPHTPLSRSFSVPLACYPKVVVLCNGNPIAGPEIGTNQCP